jgi:hypothetical protein
MESEMVNVFTGDTKDAEVGRKWLKTLLEEQTVEITFTKKDGTERIMKCTLKDDALPVVQNDFGDEDSTVRQKSKDALAVWDIESQGWRSFRWDSIKSVKFSLGE